MHTKMYEKTICTCIYMVYTKNYYFCFVHTCFYICCTRYKPVCTLLFLVQPFSYLEHAKPFSAQSISLRHTVCTRLNRLHAMLVYRNQPFCTCRVHTGMYFLRMALAGDQLSSSISSKTRLYAYVSVCTWLNHAE